MLYQLREWSCAVSLGCLRHLVSRLEAHTFLIPIVFIYLSKMFALFSQGGVAACLMYLDFFSITAQRAALAVSANCCQNMNTDEFHYVRESLALLSNRLSQQVRIFRALNFLQGVTLTAHCTPVRCFKFFTRYLACYLTIHRYTFCLHSLHEVLHTPTSLFDAGTPCSYSVIKLGGSRLANFWGPPSPPYLNFMGASLTWILISAQPPGS